MLLQPKLVAAHDGLGERQRNHRLLYLGAYGLALLTALSVWFLAIRAPLWLDETSSYWSISGGFGEVWSRSIKISAFPAYNYILWLTNAVFGSKELILRIPSVLAMLAAVYLLYRAARELFDQDAAIITAVVFCIHPIVIFASIDARPYAFGALAISSALYLLVRLRHSDSDWLAAGFGIAAAAIVCFHYLFAAILPALLLCFFAFNVRDRKRVWRQFGIALGLFVLVLLPLIPGLLSTFRDRHMFVFDKSAPDPEELGWTLVPGWALVGILGMTAAVAAVTGRLQVRGGAKSWRLLLCVSLAFIPLLILYGISAGTSLHIFVWRYRLVAVPGIALGWGLFVNRINSQLIRVLFCVAVVSATAFQSFTSPESRRHGYTWKYALEFAGKNASSDNATLLICSDIPEADYLPMPVGAAVKDSSLLPSLRYYQVQAPVVGLPRALNEQAQTIGQSFLSRAASSHQRFLALAYRPSYSTLHWLEDLASGAYRTRELGTFDGIAVVEFAPEAVAINP